jgi:hypothetical protein
MDNVEAIGTRLEEHPRDGLSIPERGGTRTRVYNVDVEA